jgi:hypothetical protein
MEKLPDTINISWCIEDVKWAMESSSFGRDKRVPEQIPDEDAREILQLVKHEHDATIGVNWDTIVHWIEYYYIERDGYDY